MAVPFASVEFLAKDQTSLQAAKARK